MSEQTDRELLALAAKAAGLTVLTWNTKIPALLLTGPTAWNPLADDGDALRLAVKLRISIQMDETYVFGLRSWDAKSGMCECWNADPCAASRRAIVRAAAAIGETL